jgi:hypothetical protein
VWWVGGIAGEGRPSCGRSQQNVVPRVCAGEAGRSVATTPTHKVAGTGCVMPLFRAPLALNLNGPSTALVLRARSEVPLRHGRVQGRRACTRPIREPRVRATSLRNSDTATCALFLPLEECAALSAISLTSSDLKGATLSCRKIDGGLERS